MIVEFRTMKSPKVCQPIRHEHLQVTVIVLANNLTLVTHNIREFESVDILLPEDWEVVA